MFLTLYVYNLLLLYFLSLNLPSPALLAFLLPTSQTSLNMSDSMCGPSNGAKNLLAHADRDRTLHQDRLVNSPNSAAGAV